MAVEIYDDHEQSERVRNWLRENGFAIVMGVVLALAGIFGWRQWGEYQTGRIEAAADYYRSVETALADDDFEAAEEQYRQMRETLGGQAYTALAGLRIAADLVEQARLEDAAGIYRDILGQRGLDSLRPVVEARLARLQYALGQVDEALVTLGEQAPVGHEAVWAELRGDLLVAGGRLAEAREAYRRAIVRLQADGLNARLVQAKMDSLDAAEQAG